VWGNPLNTLKKRKKRGKKEKEKRKREGFFKKNIPNIMKMAKERPQ